MFIALLREHLLCQIIIIRWNKIDFVESATNLWIVFNGRLTRHNRIDVIVLKVYSMLRNLSTVIISIPFAITLELAKTYLIPVLLCGSEIFTNCGTDVKCKPNLTYKNLARCAFIKRRRSPHLYFSFELIWHFYLEGIAVVGK